MLLSKTRLRNLEIRVSLTNCYAYLSILPFDSKREMLKEEYVITLQRSPVCEENYIDRQRFSMCTMAHAWMMRF